MSSGVPDKKCNNEEIHELMQIANVFSVLREQGKIKKLIKFMAIFFY